MSHVLTRFASTTSSRGAISSGEPCKQSAGDPTHRRLGDADRQSDLSRLRVLGHGYSEVQLSVVVFRAVLAIAKLELVVGASPDREPLTAAVVLLSPYSGHGVSGP